MNYILEEVNSASIDAEFNVAVALCEYYCKQLEFFEHNGTEDYFQESNLSNKEIFSKLKDDLNAPIVGRSTESVIKSILMAIPRMIAALIKYIKKSIDEKKLKIVGKKLIELKDVMDNVEKLANEADKRGNLYGKQIGDYDTMDVLNTIKEARSAKSILARYDFDGRVDHPLKDADKSKLLELESKLADRLRLVDRAKEYPYQLICNINGYVYMKHAPLGRLSDMGTVQHTFNELKSVYEKIKSQSISREECNKIIDFTALDHIDDKYRNAKDEHDFIMSINNFMKQYTEFYSKAKKIKNELEGFYETFKSDNSKIINSYSDRSDQAKMIRDLYYALMAATNTSWAIFNDSDFSHMRYSLSGTICNLQSIVNPMGLIFTSKGRNVKTKDVRYDWDSRFGEDGLLRFEGYEDELSNWADKVFRKLKREDYDVKGGKCEVSIKSNNVVAVLKMYIKNSDKSDWLVHEEKTKKPIKQFSSEEATQTKLNEIRTKPYKFDYSPPEASNNNNDAE